jgi:hypothetical protein
MSRRALVLVTLITACGENEPAPPPVEQGAACERAFETDNEKREVYRYENAAQGVTVYMDREWVEQGSGRSAIYALRSFDVDHDGRCRTLEGSSPALEYESTHHNWADRAHATIDGVRYTLGLDYARLNPNATMEWRIWVKGENVSDNSTALAETELIITGAPVSCWWCESFLPVKINEMLLENTGGLTDEAGEAEPWIELWNRLGDDVELTGWQLELGGDASAPSTWTLPAALTLARGEVLVLWLDGEPSEGEKHAPFRMPPSGATLLLRNPRGESAGERAFDSPGPGQSLTLDLRTSRYSSAPPTPGARSERQQ